MSNTTNPISPGDFPPVALNPSPEQIVEMGRAAIQLMADYFGVLPGLPIFPGPVDSSLRSRLPPQAPVEGTDFGPLLQFVQQAIVPCNRHNGHPRFFGYLA